MFVLETIHTEGIAQLSYLAGDTETGNAAVIDPRTDPEIYLKLARKHGLSITHIFETHIHADFESGSRTLEKLTGIANIYLSSEQADYAFQGISISAGDQFDFGTFNLTARHTPGHTPEHLSFELSESDNPDEPWAVFTGDSLFVGSAGRPDLLGSGQTEELAKHLYDTLYEYYLKLEDHVVIYPCHGAGSACGAGIGDRLTSTIGYERRTNEFLRCHNFDEFQRLVVEGAPPIPAQYPRLKKVNAQGPDIMERLPTVPALPPKQFRAMANEPGTSVVDTRSMLAFGGGHVEGAINIGDRPELSNWLPQMIEPETKVLLVLEDEYKLEDVQRLIVRTGHSAFAGYLAGGMKAWETAGLPMQVITQITVDELQESLNANSRLNILDVRSPSEWEAGNIPTAQHYFVADMAKRIDGLDKSIPWVTYCESGYRASIASSLMQARGFEEVHNVPGSFAAWQAANYPVEHATEETVSS